jgi:hypothetical protein
MSICKLYMEDGANIDIAAAPTQGAENISSATPTDLSVKFRSFEFNWANNIELQYGCGGADVAVDADPGRRKADLKLSLLFADGTELGYYTGQTVLAVEFDWKGALIAEAGAMYYGASLIIPSLRLRTPALPKGGVNDTLTLDLEFDVYNDGTNDAVEMAVYNTKAAYLATPA